MTLSHVNDDKKKKWMRIAEVKKGNIQFKVSMHFSHSRREGNRALPSTLHGVTSINLSRFPVARHRYVTARDTDKLMTVTPWMLRSGGSDAYTTNVAIKKTAEMICRYGNTLAIWSWSSGYSGVSGKQMSAFTDWIMIVKFILLFLKCPLFCV